MLFRFCLYGFLKNQRYFEPFWVLAFLQKGLNFFMIGLLFGFLELATNLMEIPTGAAADVLGRRRAMIASHIAYVLAFVTFGVFDAIPALFAAMFLFSIGEAFRTGTHKAIIFSWLKHQHRADEKTRIYGITRSWSKLGSALSALVAGGLLLLWGDYDVVFYLSAIPMALNLINFMGYPAWLDSADAAADRSIRNILKTLWRGVHQCFRRASLRRLLVQDMCFEGLYKSCKDYLQPVLQATAISLPVLLWMNDDRRTIVLVAVTYAALFTLSSVASRRSDAAVRKFGGGHRALTAFWWMYLAGFAVIFAALLLGWDGLAVLGFVALALLQNLWRPSLVSQIADESDHDQLATVLSVESQSKSLFTVVAAPLLGLAVDAMTNGLTFLPVAVLGLTVCGLVLLWLKSVHFDSTETPSSL